MTNEQIGNGQRNVRKRPRGGTARLKTEVAQLTQGHADGVTASHRAPAGAYLFLLTVYLTQLTYLTYLVLN